MAARLSLKGVEKTFPSQAGTVHALADINLSLDDGEFVSVVGASGCGKSTLLRIVAGLEPASGGELVLDNAPLLGPGKDRGMVFQQYTLVPVAVGPGQCGVRPTPLAQEAARRRGPSLP